MSKGYIYILTNPSFKEYVKIGYADNVEKRLHQLNRSECTPFAFRVYATYEVDSRLSDLKIHSIFDRLNPELRSIDNVNGQKRVREFYAMTAEDAYSIFEAMAEIHGCTDKLKLWELSEREKEEEVIAEVIEVEHHVRASNFKFSDLHIPVGAVLQHIDKKTVKCTVVDERHIEYNGETMYITPFVREISGKDYLTKGPKYLIEHFSYNGTPLWEFDIE